MKHTPKRYIAVLGYSGGMFSESLTLREVLNMLNVRPSQRQSILHGERELDPLLTLKQLELYDVTLEVK